MTQPDRPGWLEGPGIECARCHAETPPDAEFFAHCRLGLGKLFRRTGKRDEARDHLTTARALYREMDMRFWLEQAEAEPRALA